MGSIAMEEYDLLGDSKYRSYMTQVDRALKGFESTAEWADLIAALTKLNRVLLAHMKYPIIPRRILISKRLAQCMHPALPSGVHQKALETYDIIFKCMGTNRLAAELFIYSAGLFPLLANAALNVRSALLTVYETHFVPLGSRLTPGLNGFLSGVLPGLEEGSDHYTRTNNLLEAVVEAVTPPVFYSGLWECVATNATIRLPALTFVLAHIVRGGRGQLNGMDEQLFLLGSDIEVMCRALCLALRDSSALVQRSALDLLLQGFPVHQPQFVMGDMVGLVTSMLATLLRRDMSLNRRLFNWLLGSEINPDLLPSTHPIVKSDQNSGYFLTYSADLVVQAVVMVMEQAIPLPGSQKDLDIKPFRIITTLLDKIEIGPAIIDRIMLDIFRTLYHMSNYLQKNPTSDKGPTRQELIKTANLLFAQLETSYVWNSCGDQFSQSCKRLRVNNAGAEVSFTGGDVGGIGSGEPTLQEMCKLIKFLLEIVSIETYVETSSRHLPSMFQVMVRSITNHLDTIDGASLTECLSTVRKVHARIQPAWNVWDVTDKIARKTKEVTEIDGMDIAREVTESNPGSPLNHPIVDANDNKTACKMTEINNVGKEDETHHEALVQVCKELFTKLFSEMVETKVLNIPVEDWRGLVISDISKEKMEGLAELLDKVIQGSEDRNSHAANCQTKTTCIRLQSNASEFSEAFSEACSCLVELSSMPKYNTSCDDQEESTGTEDLPDWLQGLVICCMVPPYKDSSTTIMVQLAAVSTLVELSSMLSSARATQAKSRSDMETTGAVVVTMEPLLTSGQLRIIKERTDAVHKITEILWANLGVAPPAFHLRCVTLLHRLLDLSPNPHQVESIVAGSLSISNSSSVSVYQRFAKLWHLSRDLPGTRRTLDLCMLKMVGGLRAEKGGVRAHSMRWVEQCLARGDAGRLLEPLLLSLLDPASARVSVLHASIRQSQPTPATTPGTSPRLQKIFAISSTDNNVIFHVANNDSLPAHQSPRNKVQILTNYKGSSSLLPSSLTIDQPTTHTRFPYADMSMWINPFALVSSESEFNHDPSATPEPTQYSPLSTVAHSPKSSSGSSLTTTPSTSRKAGPGPAHSGNCIVTSLLNDLIGQAVDTSSFMLDLHDLTFPSLPSTMGEEDRLESSTTSIMVHPLHSHLLLYCRPVDSRATLHTLQALQDILSVHPRLSVSSLATTSLASPSLPRSPQLIKLLARHRQSVFGKGFSSPLSSESTSSFRSSMLLEVVLYICLYYIRSYYPSLPGLSKEEVLGNREIQLAGVVTLTKIFSELVVIVKENGKAFALYTMDLLGRCKVQKVVLHSLLAGVHSLANIDMGEGGFTEELLKFNDVDLDCVEDMSSNTGAFQVELLKLVMSIVMLEEVISMKKYEEGARPDISLSHSTLMKYQPNHPFCSQPMFLTAVLAALRQPQLKDLHHHWTDLVVSCLPFLGPALTQVVTTVAAQVWTNLEQLPADTEQDSVPSDYVLSQLECLGQLLSFCLLDPSQSGVTTSPIPSFPSSHSNTQPSMMSNLLHVFGGSNSAPRQAASSDQVAVARRSLLSTCPRLIVSLASLWSSLSSPTNSWLVGSSKSVKSVILELLSPLATVHSTHFLAAVAVAWAEVGTEGGSQATLVELVSSIKTFPTSTVISTLRQVAKSPPPVTGLGKGQTLDVSALQFFSSYLACSQVGQLYESWGGLKELLKDCCSLTPPSTFLALNILHHFVLRGATSQMDRKEVKDVQEMTCKLVETISGIAGSRLEAGTWLRGSRSVKTDMNDSNTAVADITDNTASHATEALAVLGRLLATLLDIIYQSDEKEKVLPLLNIVMYNLVPYLRSHTTQNMPLLRAGSGLLASLSEYPFTRRAWRKEGMELLLDPSFFMVDHETLKSWKTTTDSLMTHERNAFKELTTRIANLGQSNMSIFSSKELEQEQRALLLKRLAWVIFCSDIDQYQRQMPDITDRLSECLRTVPVSPLVQTAVFLCFRVILLRMSAVHVTFLWPVIITEMVVVFSGIEHELNMETPEFSEHVARLSQLDSSWVAATTTGPGLGLHTTANSPAWLGVYLGVCKLLDQAAALPADLLPQFQMYRWAFVREGEEVSHQVEDGPVQHDFVPHVVRISKLMEARLGRTVPPRPIVAGEPLLTMRNISSINELAPWFSTLSLALTRQQTRSMPSVGGGTRRSPVAIIERIIELDFLEEFST